MKLVNHLKGNLKELREVLAEVIAGNPGSGLNAGRFWYNSSTGRFTYRGASANLTPWVDNADIPDGTIANAKLATNPLARANHTGTQTASTISDFDTQVRTSRLDQMAAPTADVSLNSQKITNLANGSSASDAAAFGQIQTAIDAAVLGLDWKEAVRAATTANITLSGTQTIDGVSLIAGDRVLVKDQSTGSQNGIYVVAAGSWSRSTDADTAGDIKDMSVLVAEGTTLAGTQWKLTTDSITLGTTSLTYVQHGTGGSTYTAGNGLTLSGNDFAVGAGTGITVASDTVGIDTSVVARKYSTQIGNNASTTLTVTHNLGSTSVLVEVFEVSSGETVYADVVRASSNAVDITFAVAPTTNQYGVIVVG